MKKIIILFCVILFSIGTGLAQAQTEGTSSAAEPSKYIPICYSITNIKKYPSFAYLIFDASNNNYVKLENNDCVHRNDTRNPKLYAIRTDYFDEAKIGSSTGVVKEYLNNFNVLKFIYQDQIFFFQQAANGFENVEKIERYLKIDYLDNTDTLNIINDKQRLVYSDGTFVDQSPSGEELKKNDHLYLYFSLAGAAGLIIVILSVIIRTRKKKTKKK